jgi:glycosyltransferase involved in cell wall biosynthesis
MAPATVPYISVIIAAYDDWLALESCLESLSRQIQPPEFEVIVVDDGSSTPVSGPICGGRANDRLRVIRLEHAGISSARNHGIHLANGSILLFTDCDCVLDANCLKQLADAIALYPQDDCFQLCLTGDVSSFAGRAEDLQLFTVQQERRLSSGFIRYLNTSGFAIRRTSPYLQRGLFDPSARRGEDTLLLSRLMANGQLPRYVPGASIQHAVRLTLLRYILKGLPSGYFEGYAYAIIKAQGIRVNSDRRQRWKLLRASVKSSRSSSLALVALATVVARQTLNMLGSISYRVLRPASQAAPKMATGGPG